VTDVDRLRPALDELKLRLSRGDLARDDYRHLRDDTIQIGGDLREGVLPRSLVGPEGGGSPAHGPVFRPRSRGSGKTRCDRSRVSPSPREALSSDCLGPENTAGLVQGNVD